MCSLLQEDQVVPRCQKSSRELPGELQAHARLLSFRAAQLHFLDSHLVVYFQLRRPCDSGFELTDQKLIKHTECFATLSPERGTHLSFVSSLCSKIKAIIRVLLSFHFNIIYIYSYLMKRYSRIQHFVWIIMGQSSQNVVDLLSVCDTLV